MEQSDLLVRRIRDGTVIDHINEGSGLKVLEALGIDGSSGNGSNYSYMHVDQHALEFNPHTHIAYAGNDGGFYKYMHNLNTWIDISDGLIKGATEYIDSENDKEALFDAASGVLTNPAIKGITCEYQIKKVL